MSNLAATVEQLGADQSRNLPQAQCEIGDKIYAPINPADQMCERGSVIGSRRIGGDRPGTTCTRVALTVP
jgi:hypothetical protein